MCRAARGPHRTCCAGRLAEHTRTTWKTTRRHAIFETGITLSLRDLNIASWTVGDGFWFDVLRYLATGLK